MTKKKDHKIKVQPLILVRDNKPKSVELEVFVKNLKWDVQRLKNKYDKEDSLTSLGRANAYSDVLLIIEKLSR